MCKENVCYRVLGSWFCGAPQGLRDAGSSLLCHYMGSCTFCPLIPPASCIRKSQARYFSLTNILHFICNLTIPFYIYWPVRFAGLHPDHRKRKIVLNRYTLRKWNNAYKAPFLFFTVIVLHFFSVPHAFVISLLVILSFISPLKQKDEDDYADDEDDSQYGPHHPKQPLFLIYDWLRLQVWEGHGVRKWAGWVHSLQQTANDNKDESKMESETERDSIREKGREWDSHSFPALKWPARSRHTPVRWEAVGSGTLHTHARLPVETQMEDSGSRHWCMASVQPAFVNVPIGSYHWSSSEAEPNIM